MSSFSVMLYADCDMMAMIARAGDFVSWQSTLTGGFNDPVDYFDYIRSRSTNSTTNVTYVSVRKKNDDGYGIAYYVEDNNLIYPYNGSSPYNHPLNQAFYLRGVSVYYHGNTYNTSHSNNFPLNWAEARLMNNITNSVDPFDDDNCRAKIVLGHARQGTSGDGNHPFVFNDLNYDDQTTFTFMHNGTLQDDVKIAIRNYLANSGWFTTYHQPNNNITVNNMTDSEVFFHYLMKFIIENDNIIAGINEAVNQTDINGINLKYKLENPIEVSYNLGGGQFISTYENVTNFVLSDGEILYVFRNSPSENTPPLFQDKWHELSYKKSNNSIYSVKTLDPEGGTIIDQFNMVIIPKYGDPFEIPDFLDIPHSAFISTDITSNQTWNEDKYISCDITISNNAEITLSNSACVKLIGHCNLTIDNAQLNIANNTQLQLYNSSQVLIETDGELFLDWGSTITGCTPTTYGATPPGQPAGGEEVVPGDRIIAQNGGRITTREDWEYLNHPQYPNVPEIQISSSSGERWDGIFIRNPSDLSNYWFVNCDISGIRKLSIENISESNNIANLKLYITDFRDAGQIIARDEHILSIIGENDTNRCNIRNNHATPIVVYDSPVYIEWAMIEDNGRDINGGLLSSFCDGMYLSYSV